MAFLRYARARVIHPLVTRTQWLDVRTAAKRQGLAVGELKPDLVSRASEYLGQRFDPSSFLLTHATIVASVDVYSPTGVKTGSVLEDGFKVNRKFSDFRVTPETDKYINNNFDAWSRGVLGKSFRTFIGGHNFVEHVQVEDLSKGRIIDAVARDIGDSLYVDILIATDKKHSELVQAIENHKMGTLSMGCFLPGTQVTMADGRRIAIEDVQPGDMVLTHKGRAREVLNKQIRGGKWGIRRIQAVGVPDTIEATDNHPFFVFRQPDACACGCGEALPKYKSGRKNATRGLKRRFLRGHDKRILNPNNTYSMKEFKERKARLDAILTGDGQWVRADELRVGDFMCFPRQQAEGTVGVSTGRARLLGYFLAEGSFQKYKGDLSAVEFSFSMAEKDTFVAEVVSLLRQEFPGKEPNVYDHEHRNVCSIRLGDREAAQWFFQHGGEYSNHKVLSPEVMAWSVEAQKHLIGAWINGDGHLHSIHEHTSGTTTSYDLACQMHMLLARCGWFARMEAKIGARCVEVKEIVNGGFARDEVTGRLPLFNLIISKVQSVDLVPYTAKAAGGAAFDSQPRVRDDMVMFPITSIEEATYEGWVHNMEVDEDNSYVVSGTCSHNCTVDGTICTKCGHWAADETEMCPHIKYEKGNIFFDDQGRKTRVAELCGHDSLDPTGGVTFIEASWVETPAFTGAVLRNVLKPNEDTAKKAQRVLSTPPPQWTGDENLRAARLTEPVRVGQWSDTVAGWEEGEEAEPETEEKAPKAPESPFKDVEDELYRVMTDRVKKRIKDDLQGPSSAPPHTPSESTNENMNKQAGLRLYVASLGALLKTASSDAALIEGVATLNNQIGVQIPIEIYRAALAVGSPHLHGSVGQYKKACSQALRRVPTSGEAQVLLKLGWMLFRRTTPGSSRVTSGHHEGA